MRDEIYTLSNLKHPNIVRVVEAYERKRHIYLILEYCRGGDLYEVEGDVGRKRPSHCPPPIVSSGIHA